MKSKILDAHPETLQTVKPDPCHYPRRVLLAVCGLSPQIVTETLYALATQPGAAGTPFIPTEVHLITTVEGAVRANLSLLSDDPGWFYKLCADYKLQGISFNISHIHVMRNAQGQEMDDIRTGQDNRDAANFITAQVRAFTADADCALHVSIAGGRKTMGFYLGYALSLYGRDQDRLSHVLVSAPFESSWEFFYPTPYSRVLQTRDNQLADTATAQVSLAEIPFVRLRHGLSADLLASNISFDESVQAVSQTITPAHLTLYVRDRCIKAGDKLIKLPPSELALLAVFARRASLDEDPLDAPVLHSDETKREGKPLDTDWSKRFIREYSAITDSDSVDALKSGMDGDYFSQRKSKLHRHLKRALGAAANAYQIQDGGVRPGRYRLALPPESIVFVTSLKTKETPPWP